MARGMVVLVLTLLGSVRSSSSSEDVSDPSRPHFVQDGKGQLALVPGDGSSSKEKIQIDLYNAAEQGDVKRVERILNREDVDEHFVEPQYGSNALHVAANRGNEMVVHALLESGFRVNQANTDGWTPLISASWGGHKPVVSVLLRAGADLSKKNKNGLTAMAAADKRGHQQVVEMLLHHGEKAEEKRRRGGEL